MKNVKCESYQSVSILSSGLHSCCVGCAEFCNHEQVLSASLQRLVLIDVPWRDVRALVVHGAAAAPSLRVLEVTQSSAAAAPDPPLAQVSPVEGLTTLT